MRLQSAVFVLEETLLRRADVDKVLSILKMEGVWLYAVTAMERGAAISALADAGLDGYFRGVLSTEEALCPLSDGHIYEKAMRRLRSQTRDTVVFAGRIDSLRGAKAAGMRAAAVRGAADEPEWVLLRAEADEIVENYAEYLA